MPEQQEEYTYVNDIHWVEFCPKCQTDLEKIKGEGAV